VLLVTDHLIQIACACFLASLLVTALLVPAVQRFARRIDAVDRGGYRKVFEGAMPLLGGLAIAIPLILGGLVTAAAGYYIQHQWPVLFTEYPEHFSRLYTFAGYRGDCLVLVTGGLAILALGLVDDTRGMRARYKLAGQVAVAFFVSISGFAVPSLSLPVIGTIDFSIASLSLPVVGVIHLGQVLGVLLTTFWIVGLINAFNLIDGVDGLASGIAFIGAISLAALGFIQGNVFIALAGAALAGGLLAFLRFNFPPARIFLGDTGSMFLGYALAALSLAGAQKSEAALILIAPIFALSFPIFETLVSIVRRYLRGVPVFMGDNHHTHHRLLSKGYSQPRVVLTLYSVSALLAAAAILAAVIPEGSPWVFTSYTLFIGTLVSIAWLAGYLRPTTFRRIIERRKRNRVYHALAHYANLCLNGNGRAAKIDALLELCRLELGLAHLELQRENGTVLMAASESPADSGTAQTSERLRVKSSDDQNIFIMYAFEHPPDENRRHDVTACLAGIFDQLMLDRALKAGGKTTAEAEQALAAADAK